MKQVNENTWECQYCHKRYQNVLMADSCEKSHKMILVPISRADLMRLVQFIYTKDDSLLTESLVITLQKYTRVKDDEQTLPDL